MTPQRAKALLPIITAYAEGKTIQYNYTAGGWHDAHDISFNEPPTSYRIKPQPKLAKAYLTTRSVEQWEIEGNWDWIEKQAVFWKWVSEPFEIKEL